MSHAVVTVTDTSGPQVLRAEADAEGAVRVATALVPGAYTLIVTTVGDASAAASALVTASGRTEVGTVTPARRGGADPPPPGPWTVDPAHSHGRRDRRASGHLRRACRFTECGASVDIAPDDVTRSRGRR